jgi:hypothetical protein
MRCATATVFAVLVVTVTACGQVESDGSAGSRQPSKDKPAQVTSADDYDPGLFKGAAEVENKWFPLRPGTRLFYRGSSLDEGERVDHAADMIVTDLVKTIDGVPNVVIWERDYTEDELEEAELAFFAADKDGNVWHMGEYPEEYEDGEIVKTPAWIHGVKGATAGIVIPGQPRVGTPDYAQGYAPRPVNWVDRGRVYKTGQQVCAPVGCYDDVVVIEEFEAGLPEAFQDKHYAPGVGVVRVSWRGAKDKDKEVLKLITAEQLTSAEIADARASALEIEERAYRVKKGVYGGTPPAEVRPAH